MENFVNRLIYLNNEKPLPPTDFESLTALKFSTFKNYEKGLCYPKLVNFIKLAEFYNVSVDYLAGISGERNCFRGSKIEDMPTRIIELRRKSGLSQSAIAKQLGITKSGYKYYEMGKNVPPLNRLIDLANIFHVTLEYLIGGQEM